MTNNIYEFGISISIVTIENYCEKHNKRLLNIKHDIKYKRKDSKLLFIKKYM